MRGCAWCGFLLAGRIVSFDLGKVCRWLGYVCLKLSWKKKTQAGGSGGRRRRRANW